MARTVISPAASHTKPTRPAISRERLSVQSTPAQPTEVDKTAGWKIYTSDKYGFSLKYPSNLTPSVNDSMEGDQGNQTLLVTLLFDQNSGIELAYSSQDFTSQGSLEKNITSFKQNPNNKSVFENTGSKEFSVVNGQAFYTVLSTPGNGYQPTVYLIGSQGLWTFTSGDMKSSDTLQLMASTFKFTK